MKIITILVVVSAIIVVVWSASIMRNNRDAQDNLRIIMDQRAAEQKKFDEWMERQKLNVEGGE